MVSQVCLFVLSRLLSSLWVSCTGNASDWFELQEALYKCIDAIQYNTIQLIKLDMEFLCAKFPDVHHSSPVRNLDAKLDRVHSFTNHVNRISRTRLYYLSTLHPLSLTLLSHGQHSRSCADLY